MAKERLACCEAQIWSHLHLGSHPATCQARRKARDGGRSSATPNAHGRPPRSGQRLAELAPPFFVRDLFTPKSKELASCLASSRITAFLFTVLTHGNYAHGVGRGCGVGRGLGVALGVGETVGVGVGVGVGDGVTLGEGVGVGVGVDSAHGGISYVFETLPGGGLPDGLQKS
jgi:hypothetical protein